MNKDKPKKKRAEKYEEKLAVKGTFEQLIKIAAKSKKPKQK